MLSYPALSGRYETWHTTPEPTLQWEKTTNPSSIMKLFENFTHREWELHDSVPPTRSNKLMCLGQPSRLRLIAKSCTPQTSRTIIDAPELPPQQRTRRTCGHTEQVRREKIWNPQTNSSISCQHASLVTYASSLARCLLNTRVYSTRQLEGVNATMTTAVVSRSDKSKPCFHSLPSSR